MLVPLPVAALREAGIPEPFTFGQADRVRFGELDVLDHVNNARYLSWFETLRIGYFRDRGLSDYRPGTPRPALVLKSVAVDYRAPLHLEDVYVVAGRTRAYRRTSFTMEYAVASGGRLCALSEAVIVLMADDFRTRRPLPPAFIAAFEREGAAREGS